MIRLLVELEKKVSLLLIVKLEQNRSRGQAFVVGQLVNMDRDETIQAPFTLQPAATEQRRPD